MDDDRVFLTVEQALAMLPEGEEIHTFSNPGVGVMIGADMSRAEISKRITEATEREISGAQARSLKHGLVIHGGNGSSRSTMLFIKTT